LPEGRRRAALAVAAEAMFNDDFAGRVLPFDEEAAVHYAETVAARRREGRPIEAFDAQIAAATPVAGAALATRDVGDFAGCGVTLATLGKRHDRGSRGIAIPARRPRSSSAHIGILRRMTITHMSAPS
jgi:hypothetical protein